MAKIDANKSNMKFVPHLFRPDMVRAMLEGIKTETRRLPNRNNTWCQTAKFSDLDFNDVMLTSSALDHKNQFMLVRSIKDGQYHKLYYKAMPGDFIWVRESFARIQSSSGLVVLPGAFLYKADFDVPVDWKWTPNMHMPKPACRLFLLVTKVKAQRLQDISDQDIVREGVIIPKECTGKTHKGRSYAWWQFRKLWADIHGVESFDANPLVFAPTFEVHRLKPKSFV